MKTVNSTKDYCRRNVRGPVFGLKSLSLESVVWLSLSILACRQPSLAQSQSQQPPSVQAPGTAQAPGTGEPAVQQPPDQQLVGRISGTVLTILPIAIGGIMLVTSPSYIGVLFRYSTGKYLIAAAAVSPNADSAEKRPPISGLP